MFLTQLHLANGRVVIIDPRIIRIIRSIPINHPDGGYAFEGTKITVEGGDEFILKTDIRQTLQSMDIQINGASL